MKKLNFADILLFFIFIGIPVEKLSAFEPTAAIEWQNTTVDFGKIPVNKPVIAVFTFKNPGMIPLIITEVKSSCGCTIADYTKNPVSPGGQGKITATYDAKLTGYFSKTITVYSNTEEGSIELYLKGEVVK
jgi:hypothetical protein